MGPQTKEDWPQFPPPDVPNCGFDGLLCPVNDKEESGE